VPLIEPFPPLGHRLFVEFDARIAGVCGGGRWMLELAVESCQGNPRLVEELKRRARALLAGIRSQTVLPNRKAFGVLPQEPPKPDGNIRDEDERKKAHARAVRAWEGRRVPPFEYVDEPDPDLWRALSAAAEHFPGQCWLGDCDCLSAWLGAFFFLRMTENVGIGISQPKTCACVKGCKGDACAMCGYGMAHEYTVLCDSGLPDWFVALCHEVDPSVVLRDKIPGRTPDRIRRAIRDGAPVLAFDASVYCGMGSQIEGGRLVMYPPPPSFYGSGESAFRWID
jgi:hypothetical protein